MASSARPCNAMQRNATQKRFFSHRISARNSCRIPAPGCCAIQHDAGHVHRHDQNVDRIPTAQPTVPVPRPSENSRQPNDSKYLRRNWFRLFKKQFHAPGAQSCTTAPSAPPPQALSFRPTAQLPSQPFLSAFIGVHRRPLWSSSIGASTPTMAINPPPTPSRYNEPLTPPTPK